MTDEINQGAIQLTPKQSPFENLRNKPKKITIPKRIVFLIAVITIITLIILAISFLPSKSKPNESSFSNVPTVSPFPIVNVELGEINDPVLRAINDRITRLQTQLRNPFNYQELLSVPIVDLNISF